MLKIQNIKYPIEKDEVVSYDKLIDYIYKHISKKYKPKNLCNVELVKKSLDARTPDLSYVLSAVFSPVYSMRLFLVCLAFTACSKRKPWPDRDAKCSTLFWRKKLRIILSEFCAWQIPASQIFCPVSALRFASLVQCLLFVWRSSGCLIFRWSVLLLL